MHPHRDDIIVRQATGHPSAGYVLGTHAGPDQVHVHTRDEAVSKAVAFARHQHVRAWFAKDDERFVLLGTFLTTDAAQLPATTIHRCQTCGGALVSPDLLVPSVMHSPRGTGPDYLCMDCQQGHYWRGVPPRLTV